jgi:hypothetical protein
VMQMAARAMNTPMRVRQTFDSRSILIVDFTVKPPQVWSAPMGQDKCYSVFMYTGLWPDNV